MSVTQELKARLYQAFHEYAAKEGDSKTLSKGELKDLLKNEFGELMGNVNDPAQLDLFFNGLDEDCNGHLDFKEYKTMVDTLFALFQ